MAQKQKGMADAMIEAYFGKCLLLYERKLIQWFGQNQAAIAP
jgi:hypothetical protein